MRTFDILTQIVGFLGLLMAFITFQSKSHKKIEYIKCTSDALFAIQYVMLGAYPGAAMNAIGCFRNVAYAKLTEKQKSVKVAVICFSIIVIAFGIVTWNGPISLLAICGKLFSTISFAFKKPKHIRLATIPVCLTWGAYDIICNSWAGVLCEIMTLTSIAIAYYRYDRKSISTND